MDQTKNNIKKYLAIINPNIESIEKDVLDFSIDETIDRVQLFLGCEAIPIKIERILAKIVNTGLKKCLKDIELSKEDVSAVDESIVSISDNGQSISYSNQIRNYFTTVSDEELFTGFSSLLSRYRKIKVVYPKNDD